MHVKHLHVIAKAFRSITLKELSTVFHWVSVEGSLEWNANTIRCLTGNKIHCVLFDTFIKPELRGGIGV